MPVDVLASQWECILVEGAIRMGLCFVKGLGEGDWQRISLGRKQDLRSFSDFIEATGLDEGALAALAESGALGCFGMERREALWQVSGTKGRRSLKRPEALPALEMTCNEIVPEFSPLSSLESIGWDYSTTGHSTLGHLLEPLRDELTRKGLPDARALSEKPDSSRASYAGMVICRQRPGTANGVVFMTLEDESGFVNLVLWEKVFEKYRTLLLTNSFLGVTGKIQSKEGVTHLIVESCWVPELTWEPKPVESRDFH
jgi:error-prone DNA polymerase